MGSRLRGNDPSETALFIRIPYDSCPGRSAAPSGVVRCRPGTPVACNVRTGVPDQRCTGPVELTTLDKRLAARCTASGTRSGNSPPAADFLDDFLPRTGKRVEREPHRV